MTTAFDVAKRQRRATLLGGAAIAMLAAAPGWAQTVPVPTVGGSGGAAITNPTASSVDVDLLGTNRLIKWDSFNLGTSASASETVNFRDSTAASGPLAALNLINSAGGVSQIFGKITSAPNISIWLSNPSGIVFGQTGAFSGGSLVLTTAAFSPADRAKFDTTTGALTGTVGLNAMPGGVGVTVAGTTANGGTTGLSVTGNLIIAAQVVDVKGTVTASGDVALVAARSVTVPADLGSNIGVTITEGTTLGSLSVESNGTINAGRILVGGAANLATNLLLGIDPGATLTASAANGKVIIAAGTTSGETLAGPATRAITVAPGALTGGSVGVTQNGAVLAGSEARIDATGAITGTATGGSISGGTATLISSGGAVGYAGSLTGASGVAVTSGGTGNVTLSGAVSATGATGTGDVTITSANAVTLGDAATPRALRANGAVSITALNGAIGSLGAYTIQSGLGTVATSGITLDQRTTGAINLAGSIVRAGTEAMPGSGIFQGVFTVANTTGTVTLGTVDAASMTLPAALPADLIAQRITTREDLALTTQVGSIRVDTAESLTGNVSLTATAAAVSGRAIAPAGDGRLLDAFGRTTIHALTNGKTITVAAGQGAQLGDLVAGTVVPAASASNTNQVTIGATAIDLLTASAATGDIGVTATGAGATGTVRGNALTATLGSVTISAAGAITGQSAPTAVVAGLRAGSAKASTLLAVDAAGNARLGTLDSTNAIEVKANGSVTGLALADVTAGPGLAIAAGNAVTVGSTATRPTRVALGAVTAGAAVTVFGTAVSAQTIDTPGAVALDAGTGLSVDAIGATTRAGSISLKQTTALVAGHGTEDAGATLYSLDETLSPAFGGATLTAGGPLRLFAGGTFAGGTFAGAAAPAGTLAVETVGVGQIDSVSGGTVTVAGRALSIGTAISSVGALDLTATAGGLYLGTGPSFATTTATFTKQGATGPLDEDEIRFKAAFASNGAITVTSATDVRGVSLTSRGDSIGVTAQNSVTGLRRAVASNDGRLDTRHDRLDLTATGATNATVNVTATTQTAQLGTVRAGAAGAPSGVAQLQVNGVGVDLATATTLRGNLVLKAGATGLRLGTGTSAEGVIDALGNAGVTSNADAQIGSLMAQSGDLLLRVDGTLSGLLVTGATAPGIANGLTLGGSTISGALTLNSSGDVVYGTGSSGSATLTALGNVRIGTLGASDTVSVTATRSVTGLATAGSDTAAPGANLAASGSILLPAPTSAAGGVAAVLGTVNAGQSVTLKAGAVSAVSITAGTSADVRASSGAVVGAIDAASGSIVVSAAAPMTDGTGLTVDTAGALRSGFGFANIATVDAKTITVTATTGVAQLGTVRAGTTSTPTTALGGTVGQIVVDAQAITAQRAFANNGSLKLTAHAGDLYLGTPADGIAALAPVAGAGDRALLDKQGVAGLITINGQVTAGGSNVALVTDDDGVALVTSTTDIRGRKIVSNTGDVRLRAVGRIDAMVSGAAASPGVTLGTSAGSSVTGLASVGGLVTINGGDLRIGDLTSNTAIGVTATGSVTGLAPTTLGAGIALPFDLSAARDISVGPLTPQPVLDSATLGTIQAGRDVGVGAGNVSVASATAGRNATFSSTSGLFVGALSVTGDATLIDTAAAGAAGPTFVVDDTSVDNEALATGFGFANLAVNNAGSAGTGVAGTIVVNAANVAQLGIVSAGGGVTPLTDALGAPRDQITVAAQGITATATTSRNGGITLRATQGGLYANSVSAGTYATLQKLGGAVGGGNELRVRGVTGGTTDATAANRGEVVLSSNTDARIGNATSRTASIAVTANDVTGLLRATPASGADGQIAPAYNAADLSAPGVALAATALPASEPMQRITVTAGGIAKLGTLDAGRGTAVADATVTVSQIGVTAVAMDVASATTRNGDLVLSTSTGRLRLGAGTVARKATLTAGSVVGSVTDAEIGTLKAGSDILVNASGQVSGLKSVGDVVTIADGLRIGSTDAGGPDSFGALRGGTVRISGAGNVRLGNVTATGAPGITAIDIAALGGSVTGLAGAVTVPAPAVTLLDAGGNVKVEALSGSLRLGTAAITTIRAGGSASVNASRIAVGITTAGGDVRFIAGTALAASSITAATAVAGSVTATTDAIGTDTIDTANTVSATSVLDANFGAANLTARNLPGPPSATGTITVTALNVAQLGTVRAGVGSDGVTGNGTLLTNLGRVAPQIIVNAKAISIGSLLAFNGGADVLASVGDLWLDTGNTGGYAWLRKTGATGAVMLGTLTSGGQATSIAPVLAAPSTATPPNIYGGTALIDSTTVVRGNSVQSLTGDVLVRAVAAVTGRNPVATVVTGDFAIGSVVAGGDVTLNSGGNMRLGSIDAGGNLSATAVGSVTGTNGAVAPTGLNLTAARGVDVDRSRNGSGPLALAALGTVSAGLPVRLEDGTTIAQTVRVQAGQISATGISAPTGAVSLQAGTALNVGTITAATLDARTTGANGEVDNGIAGIPDNGNAVLAARFAGDTLATGFGNARLLAGNTKALTVTAGVSGVAGGVAQLGPIKGGTVAVTANAMTIRGSEAATGNVSANALGALSLTSRSGALYLETGNATGAATLRKNGAVDEMRIGMLNAATVDANSVTNIRAGSITASGSLAVTPLPAELSLVGQTGSVTGLALGGMATDGRLDTGYDRATLTASAANARVSVLAGTVAPSTVANLVQLGAVSAGGSTTTTDRTLNQIVLRGGQVDAATAAAANGNIVLEARNGRARLGVGTAGGGVEEFVATGQPTLAGIRAATDIEIGQATARTGDLLVTSSTGNVSGLKLLTAAATDGRTLAAYDRATLTASAANARVVVLAGPDAATASTVAQLGAVSAGAGTTVSATIDQIDVRAGKIDLATDTTQAAVANNGNVRLRALGGRARLGVVTAANNISIDASGDVDLRGQVSATGAASIITITNTGANKSEIGATATAISNSQSDPITAFALTDVEVNRLAAPTIVIDAKATALTVSTLAVGTNAIATTKANTGLALLGTGAITLTGPISATAATGRTLQLGGVPTGGSVSNGVVVPANVAASITANLDTGAAITWGGGTVDLQANRIVFGDALLRSATPGTSTAAAISLLVSNPQSVLYRGSLSGRTYLSAATLRVTYGNYALFQNSGATSSVTGGVVLGSQATPSATALRLASSGDSASNAFALFGAINGFVSTTAALQPQPVIDFSTGAPGTVRITLANSRINGCPIGSAGSGCIASTPSLPPLSLFDERQVQLFRTDDNPDLQFESLIGTNNEGLIGDLATGAASADQLGCPTGKEASCPKANEVKP